MKIKIFGLVLALLTALVPLQTADAAETLNGAGASFPYPLYSAWAYAYQKATGVRVNYQSIGSGGGQRQIVERTVDFGASDDPVAPAQLKKDTLLQFPAVIGAKGVERVIEVKLNAEEKKLFDESVSHVKKLISEIKL